MGNKFLFLIFIYTCIFMPLYSQETKKSLFQKNKMYFDLGVGSSNLSIPGSSANNFFIFAGLSSTSGNRNQELNSFALLQSVKSTDVNQNNYRFSVEYGISEWIGIGGSLNYTPVNLNGYTYGQGYLNSYGFFPWPAFVISNEFVNTVAVASLLPDPRAKKISLLSNDFELSFHAPTHLTWLDPYLRLVIGTGDIQPSGYFNKTGAILGIRTAVMESVLVSVEYYESNYQIKSNLFPGTGPDSDRSAKDLGVRFLMGTTFDSP